jgi:hypothetical protein
MNWKGFGRKRSWTIWGRSILPFDWMDSGKISVRRGGPLAEIRTLNLPNTRQDRYSLCRDVIYFNGKHFAWIATVFCLYRIFVFVFRKGRPRNRISIPGWSMRFFVFSLAANPALGPTQPLPPPRGYNGRGMKLIAHIKPMYRLSAGLHQRQKRRVANAAFLTRLTNTLQFMRAITSKASGGANAHWPRFQRRRSQRHLTNITRVNGSVYTDVPDAASL